MRRTRVAAACAASVALAGLLAACGSDPPPEVPAPNFATVVGGGKDLSFPSDPQRTSYPKVCPLIPDASARALLGAPATSNAVTGGCSWTTGAAALPSMTILFVQGGDLARQIYDQRAPGEGSARTAGIGFRSRIYRVDSDKTTRIDVLKKRVFYRVDIRIIETTAPNLENARRIALRAAQIVSSQVS